MAKSSTLFLAPLLLSPLFLSPVSAAPPEGMRWGDWWNRSSPSTRSAPRYYAPPVSRVASPGLATPGVVMTAPAQPTIAIRGPDGIIRNYPLAGTVQQTTPALVSIRGADGILRNYPVVNGVAPVMTESGVITYPCPPNR